MAAVSVLAVIFSSIWNDYVDWLFVGPHLALHVFKQQSDSVAVVASSGSGRGLV